MAGSQDEKDDHDDIDFQEVMRQATKIKEAQLAERRKDWTAAPLFMKATLSPPEDIVRGRQDGSEQDKLALMRTRKERGNDKFREEEYDAAQTLYSEAIAVAHYFEQIGEDMPFRRTEDSFCNDPEAAEDLLCQCYSNIAACSFRQGSLEDLCFAAGRAIEIRPESATKAYYRRGYGKLVLGSLDDLDDAQKDLEKALSISPDDAKIKRALKQLSQERAKYKAASKRAFANAFRSEKTPENVRRKSWMSRARELIARAVRTRRQDDGHPRQDTLTDRIYRCLLYALILLCATFVVRLSVNIYRLTVMTISRVDEL